MNDPRENAASVLAELRSARSIVVSSQTPLDGDSVGCEIALLHLAGNLVPGADVRAINESLPPETYGFLPGIQRLEVLAPGGQAPDADVLLILDCGDLGRYSHLPDLFSDSRIVNIDHHASNTRFGHLNWVRPDRASTGEMVFELLEVAGVPLTPEAAQALYVALVFDTGRFAYSNTRPATHRQAAALLEAGVRPEAVFRELERNRPEGALRMMGFVIEHLRRDAGGLLAWVAITLEDLDAASATVEDLEDLVNLPMTLAGVEVSVLLRELPDGRTKASLRSDRWFDVAEFAGRFGGGGHVRAAGMTLEGPLARSTERVTRELVAALQEDVT